MIPVYAFVDLDDSLFQTQAKSPSGPLIPTAYDRDGTPLSYMTPAQARLWQLLAEATVIPTTGRSWRACQRVKLSFTAGAIVAHGGAVLTAQGVPDPTYAAQLAPYLTPVQDVLDQLSRAVGPPFHVHRQDEFGPCTGISVKHPARDAAATAALAATLRRLHPGPELVIWSHGGHLAILPREVSKARAVAYVVEQARAQQGAILTLGLGDALSDRAFLALCDFALLPTQSDNFRRLNEL